MITVSLKSIKKPSEYATVNDACASDFCVIKKFINTVGETMWKCSMCGTVKRIGESRSGYTFNDAMKEVHTAKEEGREPVFKTKLKLKFKSHD